MCIAMSGKIISIDKTTGIADFNGNNITVEIGLVNVKVGDYVLVHAGCVIQVLSKQDNDEITNIYKELNELMQEDMKNA